MKEVALKRFAGPYEEIPFDQYIQSPVGLVPKAGNKTRLIFHLLYDFSEEFKSVNFYTLKERCTVKYRDLDHAVQQSLKLIQMARKQGIDAEKIQIWYGKSDLESAFRVLSLRKQILWVLVIAAEHPKTGKKFFFIDKCLPFGHQISCALYQRFSNDWHIW